MSRLRATIKYEPRGPKLLDSRPKSKNKLEKVGWLLFFQKFCGHNAKVMKAFALNIKGYQVQVGDLHFRLTEELVSKACRLLQDGDRWIKNRRFGKEICIPFLKEDPLNLSWGKGISPYLLKCKYQRFIFSLKKYITREGHFELIFLFHMRLLGQFRDDHIKLPYFLTMSLIKMSMAAQDRASNIEEILYHHGLVKIIMLEVLQKHSKTWEAFLQENGFTYPGLLEANKEKSARKVKKGLQP